MSTRILKLRAELEKQKSVCEYKKSGDTSISTITMNCSFDNIINIHFLCIHSNLGGGWEKKGNSWIPNSDILSELVGIKYQLTISEKSSLGTEDPDNKEYSLVHKSVLLGDIRRVAMKNKKLQHFVMLGIQPAGRKKMNVMLFKKGTATISGCKSNEDGIAAAAVVYDLLSYMNKVIENMKLVFKEMKTTVEFTLLSNPENLNVSNMKYSLINAQFDSNIKINIQKLGSILKDESAISKITLPGGGKNDHKLKVYFPVKERSKEIAVFFCAPKGTKNSIILINAANTLEQIQDIHFIVNELLKKYYNDIIKFTN